MRWSQKTKRTVIEICCNMQKRKQQKKLQFEIYRVYVYWNTCIDECVTHLQYVFTSTPPLLVNLSFVQFVLPPSPNTPSQVTPVEASLSVFLCLSLWIELNPVSVCRILLFSPFWGLKQAHTHTPMQHQQHTHTLYAIYIYISIPFL